MQVYAAMIDEMDQGIGRILRSLEEHGAANNTCVVFLSDNGASSEGHRDNKIERLDKPWTSSVIPKRTLDGVLVTPGDFPHINLGPAHTYGSYGLRWASVSNVPFRRHKSWVHEGGIATPCIFSWPDGINKPNTMQDDVAHVIDLMPTFLELANAEYPAEFKGNAITPMEGTSLVGALNGRPLERDHLCWEHEGNRAIRQGRWKLVSEYPGTWSSFYPYPKRGDWELYNMQSDRAELHDLAEARPELVRRLSSLYDTWADRSLVVSWGELEGKQE